MGRCQGFYCGAELAALTDGRFADPLAVGRGPWLTPIAVDVAIVGGGPAGLGAALALRRRGVAPCARAGARARGRGRAAPLRPSAVRDARVRPRAQRAGLCPRLVDRAPAAGVEIRTGHSVVAIEPGGRIRLTTPDGPAVRRARARAHPRHRRARELAPRAADLRRSTARRRHHRHAAGDGLSAAPGAVPPAGDGRHRAGQPVVPAHLPQGRHPAGGDDRGERAPDRAQALALLPAAARHSGALWHRAGRDSSAGRGSRASPCGWRRARATIACDGVLLTGSLRAGGGPGPRQPSRSSIRAAAGRWSTSSGAAPTRPGSRPATSCAQSRPQAGRSAKASGSAPAWRTIWRVVCRARPAHAADRPRRRASSSSYRSAWRCRSARGWPRTASAAAGDRADRGRAAG